MTAVYVIKDNYNRKLKALIIFALSNPHFLILNVKI